MKSSKCLCAAVLCDAPSGTGLQRGVTIGVSTSFGSEGSLVELRKGIPAEVSEVQCRKYSSMLLPLLNDGYLEWGYRSSILSKKDGISTDC